MTTSLMDEAIQSLSRDVPLEHQDAIARAVMRLTGRSTAVYTLSADEEADLDAADAEIERDEFATDDQVRAIWEKHGL